MTAAPPKMSFRQAPAPEAAPDASGLGLLLGLEAAARAAETPVELMHLMASDWRKITRADQIFVFRFRRGQFSTQAVSNQSSVDRTSPLIVDLEEAVGKFWARVETKGLHVLTREDLNVLPTSPVFDYPHRNLCLLPLILRGSGEIFTFVLLARETPWVEQDLPLIQRLGATFAHAWEALAGARKLRESPWRRYLAPGCVTALLIIGVLPVPLTALAPVEVVGRDPAIVSAPIDGVIRRVDVELNQPVKEGDILLSFVDTSLRGRADVAEQNVAVAQAKERRMAQAAFTDRNARRELAVAEAELGLALAERDAARDQLERSVVRAERAGIAIYQNRAELEGRPVSTGERLMQVADPRAVEYRIELPVKDAIVAKEGAPVSVYLDADPLASLDARLSAVSFHATPISGGGLAFILRATPDEAGASPRIGFRGTAQVSGHRVPLGYYLLRRPFTMLRQHLGV